MERTFSGEASAPAGARGFVRDALGELLDEQGDRVLGGDVELIVSELVTNSVRAGSDTVVVALEIERSRLVVSVSDEAQGWPEQREAGIHDTGGRGLPLVSAVSSSWGVRMTETGKTVWAALDVPE